MAVDCGSVVTRCLEHGDEGVLGRQLRRRTREASTHELKSIVSVDVSESVNIGGQTDQVFTRTTGNEVGRNAA